MRLNFLSVSVFRRSKAEAGTAAKEFRTQRLPKYLDWLESVLARNSQGNQHFLGAQMSYADL